MASVTTDIRFYNVAEFAWTGTNPFYDSDAPVFDIGGRFVFSAVAAQQIVTITDLTGEDAALNEGAGGDQFVDFADPARTVVAEGGVYGNGTPLETAWSYSVSGSDGSMVQVWGVTFDGRADAIEGVVTSAALQPGVTYTILASPSPSVDGSAPFAVIACFAAGTRIRTPGGPMAVERLAAGALVWTLDAGAQPVMWVAKHFVGPWEQARKARLCPVRIAAGALGDGTPSEPLTVSAQHRVLVRSKIAERMFNAPEVLVAACQLEELSGVEVLPPGKPVTYVHLLLRRHHVVDANGTLCETLYPGGQAMLAIGAGARERLKQLLPELGAGAIPPARPLVPGRQARSLVARHVRNGLALVSPGKTDPEAPKRKRAADRQPFT